MRISRGIMANRNSDRIGKGFTGPNAVPDCSFIESHLSAPFGQILSDSIYGNGYAASSVLRLLLAGGPFAVFLGITKIVVDSFKGESIRLFTHVFEEFSEGVFPTITNGNSSISVILKRVVGFFVAPIKHGEINLVCKVAGKPVFYSSRMGASAGHCSIKEAGEPNRPNDSTLASAINRSAVDSLCDPDYFQLSEFRSNENVASGSSLTHSLFSFFHGDFMVEVSGTAPARAVFAFILHSFSPIRQPE